MTKATNHVVPLQKPKRPLSAYNFFFSRERQKIIATNMAKSGASREEIVKVLAVKGKDMPHRKSHGTISFRTLAKVIADKWKAMTEGEKEPFKELAKVETLRYRKEVEEWKASQRSGGCKTIPQRGAIESCQHEEVSEPDSLSSIFIHKVQPFLPIHDDVGKKIPVMPYSRGLGSSVIETMTMAAEPVSITEILSNQYNRDDSVHEYDRKNSILAPKSTKMFNYHRYMHRLNELAHHLDDECMELLQCLF